MLTLFDDDSASGAEFSKNRKYRYALWRIWDESKGLIMFIGLNPSDADESTPDPTITRVVNFAKDWGYGGVYMMNLFALVSKDPKDLKKAKDPLGDNDGWIEKIAPKCSEVVFAWGNFPQARERAKQVIKMFPNAKALVLNKDGSPKHPLYVLGTTTPIPFNKKQ